MRFVVKIGSHLLTQEDHSLNTDFIAQVTAQIAGLYQKGHQPLLVTSGAVAAGQRTLCVRKESKNIPYRQALAAVGQTFLLETYRNHFGHYGIVIGQVLLTMVDFREHDHFLSTYNTLDLLLKLGVVPIINENDVTTFNETKFGNNDRLSALVASLMGAEHLVMLTDVEGFYESDPKKDPKAKKLSVVEKITPAMKTAAKSTGTSKGIGGMYEKVLAAEDATAAGVNVWIAQGTTAHVIGNIVEGIRPHGTHFKPTMSVQSARRRWLRMQLLKHASLTLDRGAVDALLTKGKSLLSSGIVRVEGPFQRGDVVKILKTSGEAIGFGQVNYTSEAAQAIKGKRSSDIAAALGYCLEDEIIHRDNLVITESGARLGL